MHYGNAEDFKKYHQERNREIPESWTDSYIDSALLMASEWIDHNYGSFFVGYKTDGYKQEREWPRLSAYVKYYPYTTINSNEIPREVEQATYEVAFREATNAGSLNADFKPNNYKAVSVEGAVSVEYNTSLSGSDLQLQIPIVDKILYYLLTSCDSDYSGKVTRK